MPANTTHPEYDAAAAMWSKCRTCFLGSRAIKDSAVRETYLPRLSEQEDDEYDGYVSRALFYNATRRTVQGMLGACFRREMEVESPEAVSALLKDATLGGLPLEGMARNVLKDVLIAGRYGILVDFTKPESPEKRPYFSEYAAENILNWSTRRVGSKMALSLVVLKEAEYVPDSEDPFLLVEETRYRVLKMDAGTYTQEIWKEGKKELELVETTIPLLRGIPLDFIPFVFFSPWGNDEQIEASPIEDLVEVNLSHYRSSADLENGRHFTGFPQPWAAGFPALDQAGLPITYKIGSAVAWVTTEANAKMGFGEFTGQGLGALEKALQQKEDMMAALGARLLEEPKAQAEAAATVRLRHSGEQSSLAGIVNAVSSGLTQALAWFSTWAGADGDVTVKLNTDFFDEPITPQLLSEVMKTWIGGGVSHDTLLYNAQRGELLPPGVTIEQEKAKIKAEGASGLEDRERVTA